ncbi:uncharacterized protein ACNLHF_024723 [Anomaloglossus baeobatrachus]
MDVIILTIEFLQKEISELEPKIKSIEDQFSNTLPSAEWDRLRQKTRESIDTFQKNLQERKRTKFIRDQEDYLKDRVYRWRSQDTNPPYRPSVHRFSASSGSDSDSYPTSSNRFLGARYTPGEKRGGARGRPGHVPRMQTRSQALFTT